MVLIIVICLYVDKEYTFCQTKECERSANYIQQFVDETQNPCENFYNYACGSIFKNHRNNFTNTVDIEWQKVLQQLANSIEGPILENDSTSVVLQKQFYKSCMDVNAIEKDNNTVILKIFKELGGWPLLEGKNWNEKDFDIFNMMIKTRQKGDYFEWFLDIDTEKEYFDQNKREILRIDLPEVNNMDNNFIPEYLEILVDIVVSLGATKNQAYGEIKSLIMFEKELSEIIDEVQKVDTNHPRIFTIDNIKTTWPKIYWQMFLNNITQTTLSNNDKVLFSVGDYLPKLGALLQKSDKRTQANYILWKILESYTPYLTKSLREKIQKYKRRLTQFTEDINIETNRAKFCFKETNSFFQYVPEADFARKHANDEKLKDVKEIIENICCATQKAIQNCNWMDDETKEKALIKLGKIRYIIGAPKEVFDEKEFNKIIGMNMVKYYSLNIIEINRELHRRYSDHKFNFEKTKITMEKMQFYSSMALVNAQFLVDSNTMLIPAGILQGEFYSKTRQSYLNYGSLGVILAHEMAHGFGIEGSMYTEGNKTTNWWSNHSKNKFFKTVECLLKNCSTKSKVDCKTMLDENFADYAAVKIAFQAYQEWISKNGEESSLQGFQYDDPNQLFFTKFATIMCHQSSAKSTWKSSKETIHLSPDERVFGSYRNSLYFSKVFFCSEGSVMNPTDKCVVF
ncbi:unnamed protein product [Brassicogethes aeneus]|uniref:Uncharacterized protein n=1 Tax=Brassicogethes aeneus TaxID=1431903 RepID=A0A9P0FEW0_BRAAE|nr:unnamed protein product [Brassicogethes aeneus]